MIFLLSGVAFSQVDTPQIWVKKTLQDTLLIYDTIYYEGAVTVPDSSRSRVVLRTFASEDSFHIGYPIDVLFSCDLSSSMDDFDGTLYRRITWAQIASRRFVDSLNLGFDNLGVFGWTSNGAGGSTSDSSNPNKFYQKWWPLGADLAGAKAFIAESLFLDHNHYHYITYGGDRLYYNGPIMGQAFFQFTPLNLSVLIGLKYLRTHGNSTSKSLIVLTDGYNNGPYGDQETYRFVDSIYHNYGIRTFCIGTGDPDMPHLNALAAAGGGAAYLANSSQLDSIFQIIKLQLSDVVGVSLGPTVPMTRDVLGPGIHYVNGSLTVTAGAGYVPPDSFYVDYVNGLTRMNIMLDTLRAGKVMEVRYDITAEMSNPNIFQDSLMRANNTQGDDTVYYSMLQYRDIDSALVEKPIQKNYLLVRSRPGGIFLSTSPDSLVEPSTGVVSLTYKWDSAASYPVTPLYALLQQSASDTAVYTPVQAKWYFPHPLSWTVTPPVLNGAQAYSQNIGVTVTYDNAAVCTLRVEYTVLGMTYTDYLIFSAQDAGDPERLISVAIDTNTAPPFISRLVVSGDTAFLRAYSDSLYARGITNWNNNLGIAARWSASGFSIYSAWMAGLFNNTPRTARRLTLSVPVSNFPQTDSGFIRIDSGGLSYSLKLVIYDLTDYDTTEKAVIYDTAYGFSKPVVEAYYPLQTSRNSYMPDLGDSLVFFCMTFDTSASSVKYLGNKTGSWRLNNNAPVSRAWFGIRGTTAMATDSIFLSYTNEWGQVKRDTVVILWGLGKERRLFLEGAPGIVGSTASTPLSPITIPESADTVRGFYAVVRDEYGNCVYPGETGNYAVWFTLDPQAPNFVELPADSGPAGWMFKQASPASPVVFYLYVQGLPFMGFNPLYEKDSVQVTIANYTYTAINIHAASYVTPYLPGDSIPPNDTVRLSCSDPGSFMVHARRSTGEWDTNAVPVEWTVQDGSIFAPGTFPVTTTVVTLSPIAQTPFNRLIATWMSGTTPLRDTLRFMVLPPALTSISLDSVQTAGTGLNLIEITGTRDYIRTRSFTLFANGLFSCSAAPGRTVMARWTTTASPAWFSGMVNAASAASRSIAMSAMPVTDGSHSFECEIQIDTGALAPDRITFRVRDTTDYDTVKYLVVDTSDYGLDTAAYPTWSRLLTEAQTTTRLSLAAGDTARLYALLFDVNRTPGGLPPHPKLLGTDYANWEIHRGATHTVLDTQARAYAYTSLTAWVSDTLIITYPQQAVTPVFDYPMPPSVSILSDTIIIDWSTGLEVRMYLYYHNERVTNTPIPMDSSLDTITVYARLFDQFDNPLLPSEPDVMLWSISATDPLMTDSLTVPAGATHTGLIVKLHEPDSTEYQVLCTLPPGTDLGYNRVSPAYALYDTVYVRAGGHFSYDSILIYRVSGTDTLPVTAADTLVLAACTDSAAFIARVHNTRTGWEYVSVQWFYNGQPSSRFVRPVTGSALDTLSAVYYTGTSTLTARIYLRIINEYLTRIWAQPAYATVTGSRGDFDTTLYLTAYSTTTCGRPLSSPVRWEAQGFTDTHWQDYLNGVLGPALQTTKQINFNLLPLDSFAQNDTGIIRISIYRPEMMDTLSATMTLIIRDLTDYDTVDAVVVLPDTCYRRATDKDALYSQYYSAPLPNYYAGDSVILSALLFDVGRSGVAEFLGSDSAPGMPGSVRWYLNRVPSTVDSVFRYSRTRPGVDTLTVIYGSGGGDTIAMRTILVYWGFGRARLLYVEGDSGFPGSVVPNSVDTLRFPLTAGLAADTVYSVVRDEFGNFVANSPVKWNMSPPGYIYYLTIDPYLSTNCGWVQKHTNPPPPGSLSFTYYATLPAGMVIQGVAVQAAQRDTVIVQLVNYTFNAVNIYAHASSPSPVTDTLNHVYAAGDEIPYNRTLQLTALEDTIVLSAWIRRNDNGAWDSNAVVSWRLTNYACVEATSLPSGKTVTLAPVSGLARDTLIASYNTGVEILYDTVFLTVERPYVYRVVLVPGATTLYAGDTFSFVIYLLDRNGDTIAALDRLPGDMQITTSDSFYYIGGALETVINDAMLNLDNPFADTISRNRLVPFHAGLDTITLTMRYPISGGRDSLFQAVFFLTVSAAAADSIVVIRVEKERPAVVDTLNTYSPNVVYSTASYRVELYDRWGNLLPSSRAEYAALTKWVFGEAADPARFLHIYENRFEYRAMGSAKGGWVDAAIALVQSGDTLDYSFRILIVSLVQVQFVSTHEWLPDTAAAGNLSADYVLSNVLNVNPTGLSGREKLDELAKNGYRGYRDGFLDYLNFQLSEPLEIETRAVTGIRFTDIVGGVVRSVTWRLSDSGSTRSIRLLPTDTLPADTGHFQYRLWLIPNSADAGSPTLETGLLPSISFDNDIIDADSASYHPRLGDGASVYTTARADTRDSAAPVIGNFVLQNNQCNPNNPNNVVRIIFSEPVRYVNFPDIKQVTAFALLNPPDQQDTTFMRRMVIEAERMATSPDDLSAWNYEKEPDRMMTYKMIIYPVYNSYFTINQTLVRFCGDAANMQVADLNGLTGCGSANRATILVSDSNSQTYVCALSGPTVVNRYDAMIGNWVPSNDPNDHGELVPAFPFFGFTISPDMLSSAVLQNQQVGPGGTLVSGRGYVVMDFDSTYPLVTSEVNVFDLFGNLTASPASHTTLKAQYTVSDVRRLMGLDTVLQHLNTMSAQEISRFFRVDSVKFPAVGPDTLRPIYPTVIQINYEYLRRMCGPNSGVRICVPAWNCLNAKGRLVAPGGYMVVQHILAGGKMTTSNKKLIVTSGKRE